MLQPDLADMAEGLARPDAADGNQPAKQDELSETSKEYRDQRSQGDVDPMAIMPLDLKLRLNNSCSMTEYGFFGSNLKGRSNAFLMNFPLHERRV